MACPVGCGGYIGCPGACMTTGGPAGTSIGGPATTAMGGPAGTIIGCPTGCMGGGYAPGGPGG